MGRFERILATPWQLVLVVALVLAVPLLALGEASATASREQLRADRLDAAKRTAQRAASAFASRTGQVRETFLAFTARPVTGASTELIDAVERHDAVALRTSLSSAGAAVGMETLGQFGNPVSDILVFNAQGLLLDQQPPLRRPPGTTAVGEPFWGLTSVDQPVALTDVYVTGRPGRPVIEPLAYLVVRIKDARSSAAVGYAVAALSVRHLAEPLISVVGAGEEIYLIDQQGRLVVRTSHALASDPETLRPLLTQPAVSRAPSLPAAELPDPLSGSTRYVASADVRDPPWRVVLTAPTTAVDDLDRTLALQRGIRVGLVVLLLAGSALLSVSVRSSVRRRAELASALDQQTAVSDVLKAISRTTRATDPVYSVIAERAARLTAPSVATVWRLRGGRLALEAHAGEADPGFIDHARSAGLALDDRSTTGRAVTTRSTVRVDDALLQYRDHSDLREFRQKGNYRSVLAVPIVVDGDAIGAISVGRLVVRPFTDREVSLVETFAEQAVIAVDAVRLFQEIEEKSRQLEAVNRHKSEFLANMSHELRTPLNAIIGFSEVVLTEMFGTINEKQREYLDDVLSSARHLLSLINDVLDLSKVEAGRMDLELSEFSPASVVDDAITLIRERAVRHGIEIAADVAPDVGRIVADERKVKQIILNLLTNAVKFTADGGWVGISVRRDDAEIEIAVKDTGIGIAPEDQRKVFEEFRQVGKADQRAREGTGLGLTLTRRFVELHGGRIWIESEVGKGSTFTFRLPARATALEAVPAV